MWTLGSRGGGGTLPLQQGRHSSAAAELSGDDNDFFVQGAGNELTEEKWREVFVERCPATDSVPAHFKLLSGDTRKVLDEPSQGCPGGIIADDTFENP